jgi:hypothetical protein
MDVHLAIRPGAGRTSSRQELTVGGSVICAARAKAVSALTVLSSRVNPVLVIDAHGVSDTPAQRRIASETSCSRRSFFMSSISSAENFSRST